VRVLVFSGHPYSGIRFGLDAFHSPSLSAFQQPYYSPIDSFNITIPQVTEIIRNTTEDEARKIIN